VLVCGTGQNPGAATLKMSDPPATIAKRFVYPFQCLSEGPHQRAEAQWLIDLSFAAPASTT